MKMSDEEYLEKYQKIYGNLTEEEKVEALKDVASKIDIIEKALKEDDPSFGALDDLQ